MPVKRRKRMLVKSKTKVEPQVEVLEEKEEIKEPEVKGAKPNEDELKVVRTLTSQLNAVKQEKKLLEAREKELADKLKEFTKKYGVEDSKGTFNYNLGDFILTNTARITSKLNQDKAVDTFTKLGILKEVSEIKSIVNEDLVEQAILNDKVPKEILDDIMDTRTSYALTLKEVKEEVEEDA